MDSKHKMDSRNWDYKTEGFDSIILSWIGPKDSPYYGKCLRLFKVQEEKYRRNIEIEINDFTERVMTHQKYIKLFILPFLSCVDYGKPVTVDSKFVQEIADKVQAKRPSRRINESHICVTSKIALLHDDHIDEKGLVIEIQPKWGFLPDSPLIKEDSIKRKVSHFQMMQRLKLKNGQITKISNYNPPDLFSGNKERILKAINDIIENPQGNLKVFRNSKTSKMTDLEKEKLVDILYNQSVLNDLLKLQRLDFWNVEYIQPILEKANNPKWEELVDDENVVKCIHKMINEDFRLPELEEIPNYISNMTENEARVHIAAFLISQAAKDCSIMISFPKDELSENPELNVIDFDLKMPENIISRYLKSDQEIISTFLEMNKN